MPYHCFRCQAPLTAGALACSRCGQKFEAPVPAFAPAPAARTAPSQSRGIGLWVAGGLGIAFLIVAGLGYAGYRAVQNASGMGLGSPFSGSPAAAGSPGSWSPSPSLTAQLGPAYRMDGPAGSYTIQPPRDYTLTAANMQALDGSSRIYKWAGPEASDGTVAFFQVMLGGASGQMISQMTSNEDVQFSLLAVQHTHSHVVSSPVQNGHINGLPFSRAYWKGIGPRTGRRFHGLLYCQIAAPSMIVIAAKDSEPASRSSLPLFDAAALTLQKQ